MCCCYYYYCYHYYYYYYYYCCCHCYYCYYYCYTAIATTLLLLLLLLLLPLPIVISSLPVITHNCTTTVLLERLQTPQVGKKFPIFWWTPIFITVFITFHHLFVLSQIVRVLALPVCFSTNCFNASPTLSFPNGLFLSDFSTKLVYAFLLLPTCATYPAYIILIHLITCTVFGDKYNLWSSFLYNFLQSSHPSDPRNSVATLLSTTLRVGSCV